MFMMDNIICPIISFDISNMLYLIMLHRSYALIIMLNYRASLWNSTRQCTGLLKTDSENLSPLRSSKRTLTVFEMYLLR